MARPPKYQCNENYFSTIQTESQAYILGFLWADGSVNKNSGIRVVIKAEDKPVLDFIQSELNSNYPISIRIRMNRQYADLSINRLKLTHDLFTLGITPNKSENNCQIPKIDPSLLPFFMRGLFDGDGSIWRKGKNCWAIDFTGGYDFLTWIKTYLESQGMKTSPIRQRYKGNLNSCMLDMTGKDNILKLKKMFNTGGFRLARKKMRFDNAYCHAEAHDINEKTIGEQNAPVD